MVAPYVGIEEQNLSEGFGVLFQYINTVTSGVFSIMLLIATYLILLAGYYHARDDFMGGLAVAGFSTAIFAFLLFLGGVIDKFILAFVIGIAILSMLGLFFPRRD